MFCTGVSHFVLTPSFNISPARSKFGQTATKGEIFASPLWKPHWDLSFLQIANSVVYFYYALIGSAVKMLGDILWV